MIKKVYNFLNYYFPFIPFCIEYLVYYLDNIFYSNNKAKIRYNDGKDILDKYVKNDDSYYIICANGIGDTVIICSLCKYIKCNKKKLTLIVKNNQKDIGSMYQDVKKVIGISNEEMKKMIYYVYRSKIFKTDRYFVPFFQMKMSKKGRFNWSSAKWNKKLTLMNKYKENVFNIKISSSISYPDISRLDVKNHELVSNLKNKKVVVLMPFANTVVKIKDDFWKDLALKLSDIGYIVYTNIGNEKIEKPIYGTKSLKLSLSEMLLLSGNINMFISLRSGMCELLANVTDNLIVINDNKKNYQNWDDVNIFSKTKKIINVYYSDNNLIDNIIEKLWEVL